MFKVNKRCIRCLSILNEDGTCPNKNCVKNIVEVKPTNEDKEGSK